MCLCVQWSKCIYLWEPIELKILLECRIVSKVLEVKCLLWAPELLGLLCRLLLLLGGETSELLLLLLSPLLLLLLLLISELPQGIPKLRGVEECVDAIDKGLEKRAWKNETKYIFKSDGMIKTKLWVFKLTSLTQFQIKYAAPPST